MRAHDWSGSQLGSPASWPAALKTIVGLMLHCQTPAFVLWGPALALVYNDACLELLGEQHPAALGRPFDEALAEWRAQMEPLLGQALSGQGSCADNICLTVRRNGQDAPAWFSLSCTPFEDSEGGVPALYAALTETTAQVLAGRQQQERNRQLCSAFEQAPSGMAMVREPSHVYELANSAYRQLVGGHDVTGRPVGEVAQQQGQEYLALLDQVYATGKPFVGQRMPLGFARQADGQLEQRLIDVIFQPITGAQGAISGILIEADDVTEHARTEDEMRQSQRHALETAHSLEALLQAAPVGIAMMDLRGKVIRINPASQKLWGEAPQYESIDASGQWRGWEGDGLDGRERPSEPCAMALTRALRGEEAPRETLEVEPVDASGTRRTVLNCAAPLRDAQGRIIGAVAAQVDITERAQIESALRQTAAQYRILANAIPQIVWGALPDGQHDYYNQQWYDYTGVAVGSADGEGWKDLFHPDDQAQAFQKWQHSLASGEPYEIEYRLRHRSGLYRWVLGRALPVRNAQGAITRWMGTCTDIHEQKLAQEALLRADRLKDEFLAMLAHELRNPLAPIATAADLLSMGQLGEAGVRQLSEVIARQSRHMTRLIDDLLDVSRVTRGQVTLDSKPVDMKSIVSEAVEQIKPLLEGKGHYLELQLAPERALVQGDRMRLVQVVSNVLNNAIKYTPNGGCIALRTVVEDDQLMLCVRDNGIGMSHELADMAFELFTQGERTSDRSQGGLGIGLALVQSLVRLHGGTVRIRSEGANLGSEVTIRLPCLPSEDGPRRLDADAGAAPADTGPLRILVVDDNADAARLLGMFIELLGHEVQVQFHPVKALECARQFRPHIGLLDIGLPDMDGYTLARQLRLIPGLEDAVLAAVTGYSQPRDKRAAFEAGFNFHFAKPVNTRQLESWLAEVAMQLPGRRPPAPARA